MDEPPVGAATSVSGSPILIVHCGNASQTMIACCGNHDSWFRHVLTHPTEVLEAWRGDTLPAVDGFGGVVVTGSPKSVTDLEPWMDDVASYIRRSAERGIGVLGVCF